VHARPIEEEEDAELHADAVVDGELPGPYNLDHTQSNNKTSTSTREKAADIEMDNKHQLFSSVRH
jgi:hypothetical protein